MMMKKRILIIAAAVIMMISLASCSVPAQTYDAGDISLELPIHYVSMDEMMNNEIVQSVLAEYLSEGVSIDTHIYASPVDMALVSVSKTPIDDSLDSESISEFVEAACDELGSGAELVEMGGTYGIKCTVSELLGEENASEELQGLNVVALYYLGDGECTIVTVFCSAEKYDEGCAKNIADSIVVK